MARQSTNRSVGRPRQFDEAAVLASAMDAFWENGYEATSMADLCDCTGLHKGSLYQTFGDKHALFMRALEYYADSEFSEVIAEASRHDSPMDRLRAAVRKICDDAGHEKGCLIINSMVELAPHDPDVRRAVGEFGRKRMGVIVELIAEAQRAGEIRTGLDPARLGRQLMITLAGSAAMVKGLLSRQEIRETLDDLITSWA